MQDLIKQEQFELEVLDRMNSGRFLEKLVFFGGTMLRLCHGLDRYSVGLDFRMLPIVGNEEKEREITQWFDRLIRHLGSFYDIRDAKERFHTLVLELGSSQYPRSLKIEIRKDGDTAETDQAIAYSPHSTTQILLRTVSLSEMMTSKIAAFLDRGEIRDAYDLEFLVKRGVTVDLPGETAKKIETVIEALTPLDYNVKLGSLLTPEQRSYYREKNFIILKQFLQTDNPPDQTTKQTR
ncbi:MAG: nucleotidyl transferase AbiEii/AbiGii toxin family protein [Syntrophales bacterium]|nr:nucleotidyl transferase AbiEii/AbiGii toxin family protein [Syntrophales bacterium]